MANVFTLTDGVSTVSLNAGSYLATSYQMATVDGRDLTHATETLEVTVSGASLATIQTNVRAIETLVEAAKRRATNQSGPRVYFTAQWDGEGSSWRAEVTDARLETTDVPDQFRRGKVDVALVFTRGPFEGAEVQLALANSNGSGTSERHIFNNGDGSGITPDVRNNWVQIAGADVGGVLPAPVRLQFVNKVNDTQAYRNWWLACNAWNDPANFTHVIEGESRVTGYGTITASTAALCSGSNYNALSVTTSGQMQWDLSAATVADCAGYPFRVLIRYFGTPPNYHQICVYDSTGLVELISGDLVQSDTYAVQDLGVIRIPPDYYASGYAALRLVLKLWVTGTVAVNVDYLQLMPADTTRLMVQRGMAHVLDTQNGLDESEGRAYGGTATGGTPIYVLKGNPLMLTPGKLQRIYLLVTDSTGGSDIADNWTLQAWYRPRRWSI